MFCGEYVHPLDDKNRVVFPARLRDSLLAEKLLMGFYLTRGFDGSLLLYPKEEWDVMADKIGGLPSTKKRARDLQRQFFGKATHVLLDRQGRILLPEGHRELAEVNKEVVFVGVGKHVELWAKEKYGDYDESSSGSYEELAEEALLGGDNGSAPAPEGQ